MITKTFMRASFVSATLTFMAAAYAADFNGLEAAKHIGETATVTDKVESAFQAKGGNIFLNMGGRHPDETFTVFVPASAAAEFKDIKMYDGKTISVTGKIEDHKGKPQISIKSPSEITIKSDAGAAATSASVPAVASPTLSASPSASVSP